MCKLFCLQLELLTNFRKRSAKFYVELKSKDEKKVITLMNRYAEKVLSWVNRKNLGVCGLYNFGNESVGKKGWKPLY